MVHTRKAQKPAGRGERRSAAWGKRFGVLALVLVTELAFAGVTGGSTNSQMSGSPASASSTSRSSTSRVQPELQQLLAKAQQGKAGNQFVKVIVVYKQDPGPAHFAKMHNLGGTLHAQLHVVKGAAFTIPVSALPALEADPDVVSVSIDHPMTGLDDTTDIVTGITAAWSAGYNGTGIGVAVIDSGINDSHPDLWN